MKDIFEYLKEQNELCEIYDENSESGRFFVGYILSYDEDFVFFQSISTSGKEDGIQCRIRESIVKIQTKTLYLKDIQKIMKNNNEGMSLLDLIIEHDNLMGILEWAKKENRICTIILEQNRDESILGKIENIGDKYVEVQLFDEHGNEDGICYFLYSTITDIRVGAEEEKRIEHLLKDTTI